MMSPSHFQPETTRSRGAFSGAFVIVTGSNPLETVFDILYFAARISTLAIRTTIVTCFTVISQGASLVRAPDCNLVLSLFPL